ncbi:hypothetical protein FOZ63_009197 [Perkinsus olseni]|uniref:Mei2-like C-terminal RNA recognition motif domain-containing protein n=1 Tax=Perkinsus olseni TaxID=32597 RepID=A0A7J6Q5G3_PEROL|nr:hypothetical protein FOZ62_003810 [Perkinsus olseni]KAF4749107.1 hypothetical protein FOZ63_009197 [Perkinsus olseni]
MSSPAEHYLDGPSEGPVVPQLPPICNTCGRVDLQDIYSSLRVLQSLVANVMPARRPCNAHAGMVHPSQPRSNVCSCRPLPESTPIRPDNPPRGRSVSSRRAHSAAGQGLLASLSPGALCTCEHFDQRPRAYPKLNHNRGAHSQGPIAVHDHAGAAPMGKLRPQSKKPRPSPDGRKPDMDYGNPSLGHSSQVCAQKEVTTLMMRHIPNRYSQSELIQEVTATGFGGTFDFFYLPMDHSTRANFGYCFINFTTPAVASLFTHVFSGKQLKMSTSRKIIEIVPAKLQGFDANLLHYSKKAVSSDSEEEFRPLFLVDGYRLSFSRVPLRQSREMGKQSSRQRSACPGKIIDEDTHTHLAQDIEAILRNACKLAGVDKTEGEGKVLEASYAPYVFDGGPEGLCWMEGPDQVVESSPIAAPISSPIPSPDFPIFLDNDPRLTIVDGIPAPIPDM